jgi:methyl-accepting chemotaxis protein
MNDIKTEIACTHKMGKNVLEQRATYFFTGNTLRHDLNNLWARHSDVMTRYYLEFWGQNLTKIHTDAATIQNKRTITQPELAQICALMSASPFMVKEETIWLKHFAKMANISWLGEREDLMVHNMTTLNAGLLNILSIELANDQKQFLADVQTLQHLSFLQFEIMAQQRADLQQVYNNRVINQKGKQFTDSLHSRIDSSIVAIGSLVDDVALAKNKVGDMNERATEAAIISQQTSDAMQNAASTASGLVRALDKISEILDQSGSYLDIAENQAHNTMADNKQMADSTKAIESVLSLIREIAGQTNLLALNATIEAARAGDAGRGFAVVAQEVKSLAQQTASATDKVAQQIAEIQNASAACVASNKEIMETVVNINKFSKSMKENLKEQAGNVMIINSAIDETAIGASTMGDLLSKVSVQSRDMLNTIDKLVSSSGNGHKEMNQLVGETREFLSQIAG